MARSRRCTSLRGMTSDGTGQRRGRGIAGLVALAAAGAVGLAAHTSRAECAGCKHDAAAVHVVGIESTYYTREHIDERFSGKLRECYRRAGWHPGEEKQLDYLVAYDAETGRVTNVKGSMFGRQANPDLLHCLDKELTGVEIGKVRKDREVHGFAMTVRVE